MNASMAWSDWLALGLFFLVLLGIGLWAYHKVSNSKDFYLAGGRLPWWIAGFSHHVSGYSGVVFTGYAAIAYALGFTIWVWWAVSIALACFVGAFTIAPRWARLRQRYGVVSPTEYLRVRYGLVAQQLIAWCGVLLKLLDVGAKYAAIGVLMNGFTGLPIPVGILLSGIIALLYVTVGGLWADALNDTFQFLVQFVAGLAMFILVGKQLGGLGANYLTMWDQLPVANLKLFNGPYTLGFALAMAVVAFLSYNGGTWNLALRYLSVSTGSSAKKTALLSGFLYLIWPLIMFAPMWAAPLLIPGVPADKQSGIYSLLTLRYLPNGLIGVVLASMFAATMSMIASDANAVSSVISRDIIPVLQRRRGGQTPLWLARSVTLFFTIITLIVALNKDYFGGILGLIITWFAALLGPAAIPMILGLLPAFKHTEGRAAVSSIALGFAGFIVVNFLLKGVSQGWKLGVPVFSALCVYILFELIYRARGIIRPGVAEMLDELSSGGQKDVVSGKKQTDAVH